MHINASILSARHHSGDGGDAAAAHQLVHQFGCPHAPGRAHLWPGGMRQNLARARGGQRNRRLHGKENPRGGRTLLLMVMHVIFAVLIDAMLLD